MRHDPRAHLWDIVSAAERIEAVLADCDWPRYESTFTLQWAVERGLEIVGEASRRLRDADAGLIERLPDSSEFIGLRDVIAHGYDKLIQERIRKTVTTELPAYNAASRALLDEWGWSPSGLMSERAIE